MREGERRQLFLAYFLYSNGVSAILYFTSLYASVTLKYDFDEILIAKCFIKYTIRGASQRTLKMFWNSIVRLRSHFKNAIIV